MSSQSREEVVDDPVEYLRERTRADPQLRPEERETTFTVAADEDSFRVHSEEAAIIRRLLCHDDVRVDALGLFDGEAYRTVSFEEAPAKMGADDLVVRLKGHFPVRFFGIRDSGRTHDRHSAIVSKEVFNE